MALLRRRFVGQLLLCCWCAWTVPAAARAAEQLDEETAGRMQFLAAEIARHDELYFREARPEISDAEYDGLKRELAQLRERFPEEAAEVWWSAKLGDDRVDGFLKQRHLEQMLGLEKVYSEAELQGWFERVARAVPGKACDVVIEPKYDGLAVAVTYANGRLQRVVTRGNGEEGDDVTENARRFCSMPETLDATSAPVPELVEIRGEVFMTHAEFERINQLRGERGESEFASPRNLAAGTLKLRATDVAEARRLEVVFFGVGAWQGADEVSTHGELVQRFRAWGLPIASRSGMAESFASAASVVREWGRARGTWAYPTDGVVLKVDSFSVQRALGSSREAPRWAVAFKFAPERVVTRLRAIRIQVGRSGVLTPVAELEPVELSGSVIARAGLYNAEEIARRDLRVGDYVVLERAGEVIPRIVGVDLARRSADARPFSFPEQCPVCGAAVEQRPAEVARRCSSLACPAQLKGRLRHFASAGAVGIKGLGPATIDALVETENVKGIADLYALRAADVAAVTKRGIRSADTLIASIAESRRTELWRVLHGVGLPGVGAVGAKALAARFDSLAELAATDEAQLRTIDGVDGETAKALMEYLRREEVRRELRSLDAIFEPQGVAVER